MVVLDGPVPDELEAAPHMHYDTFRSLGPPLLGNEKYFRTAKRRADGYIDAQTFAGHRFTFFLFYGGWGLPFRTLPYGTWTQGSCPLGLF